MNSKMSLRQPQNWALSLLAMAIISAPTVAADEQRDSKSKTLDTQVVLGAGSKVSILENPASVSVISKEDIQKTPAIGVADQLRNLPGVQVYDDGTPGMMRIRIRGEESRRVTIQIDGHAITDHSAYGAPMLIDPSIIERIEVVRGPSSVLSGSNAIGGVVNIITKRGGSKPLEGSITATGFSATSGYSTTANLMGAAGNVDWRLTAGKAHEGDRRTPEGRLNPTDYENDQVSLHLGQKLGDKHYVALKLDRHRLEANTLPYFSDLEASKYKAFEVSLPKRDMQKAGLFYEGKNLNPWMKSLETSLYYQTVDRDFKNHIVIDKNSLGLQPPVLSGARDVDMVSLSDDEQSTAGVKIRSDLDLFPFGGTVVGLEYEFDQLETTKNTAVKPPIVSPAIPETANIDAYDKAEIKTRSIYVQQKIEFDEKTTAYLGGRYYMVDAERKKSELIKPPMIPLPAPSLDKNDDGRFLGSFGLVHRYNDDWSVRANYSQGYSYPTLQQLFLTTMAGGTVVTGNQNLKPEKAEVAELGTRWNGDNVMMDLSVYHVWSKDYILEIDTGTSYIFGLISGGEYSNVHKADTQGVELQTEYYLTNDTTLYANANYTRRELDYGNGIKKTTDSGTPRFSGRLGVRQGWMLASVTRLEMDVFTQGESTAKLVNPEEELGAEHQVQTTTPAKTASGYGTFNAHFNLQHSDYLDVNLHLNNLFNKTYHPYGELMGAGRSAVLSTTFRF